MKRVENRPFPVYQGTAGRLGLFEPPLAAEIVHFYGGVAAFLMTIEKISIAPERPSTREGAVRTVKEMRILIEQCRQTISHLDKFSREAFNRLKVYTSIPREQLAALAGNMERNAQTY